MAWCMNLPAKRGGLARSLKFLPASILNGTASRRKLIRPGSCESKFDGNDVEKRKKRGGEAN
jgi:hypothetical protein